MGAIKILAAMGIILVSTFVILPTSLQLVFGGDLPPNLPLLISMALLIPIAGFAGFEMWKGVEERREERRIQRKIDAIEQQTYGCIKPQVLDSFVVFPVCVNKRGCAVSSWVEIGEQAIAVDLCAAVKLDGSVDTEGALRRLCVATFREELEVIIYCGGGTAGPTGLSVGVGRPGFGPYLASNVAHSIHDAMRCGTATH